MKDCFFFCIFLHLNKNYDDDESVQIRAKEIIYDDYDEKNKQHVDVVEKQKKIKKYKKYQ